MSVAYVVLAHTNAGQVARLVRRLAGDESAVFVHLDRAAGRSFAERFADAIGGAPNVFPVRRRKVHWGHFSVVQATLDCLAAIDAHGFDPAQTLLLSGQDYPIKPVAEIAETLGSKPDLAFVRHWSVPSWRWDSEGGGRLRFERVHFHVPGRGMVRSPLRRSLPGGWTPFGGFYLCSLGRAHRRFVLGLMDEHPERVRYFRRTLVPDELFFPTVLLNSPLRATVVNDHLRFMRWSGGSSPELLGVEFLPELAESPALFARKFDDHADAEVLDRIDRELLGLPRG